MDGLTDLDGGPVALDFHKQWAVDLTDDLLESRSWQWLLARAYALLDLDSYTRKVAHRVV